MSEKERAEGPEDGGAGFRLVSLNRDFNLKDVFGKSDEDIAKELKASWEKLVKGE